jgi:hypothetical protein
MYWNQARFQDHLLLGNSLSAFSLLNIDGWVYNHSPEACNIEIPVGGLDAYLSAQYYRVSTCCLIRMAVLAD